MSEDVPNDTSWARRRSRTIRRVIRVTVGLMLVTAPLAWAPYEAHGWKEPPCDCGYHQLPPKTVIELHSLLWDRRDSRIDFRLNRSLLVAEFLAAGLLVFFLYRPFGPTYWVREVDLAGSQPSIAQ